MLLYKPKLMIDMTLLVSIFKQENFHKASFNKTKKHIASRIQSIKLTK